MVISSLLWRVLLVSLLVTGTSLLQLLLLDLPSRCSSSMTPATAPPGARARPSPANHHVLYIVRRMPPAPTPAPPAASLPPPAQLHQLHTRLIGVPPATATAGAPSAACSDDHVTPGPPAASSTRLPPASWLLDLWGEELVVLRRQEAFHDSCE